MPGIASAATSILISHVAAGTHSIRVGAGGISPGARLQNLQVTLRPRGGATS